VRFAGELAALGTAFCWSAGANFFAAAGRRIGPAALNRLRLTAAGIMLCAALFAVRGSPWPAWATTFQVTVLAASGIVGFVFGDAYYFKSLVILGPGRAALLTSLSPLFTMLIAWPVLRERPGPFTLAGVALTIGGVTFVLRSRAVASGRPAEGTVTFGIIAGLVAALGQAGGYVLSKMALQTGLDSLSATVIRVAAACAGIWILAAAQGAVRATFASLRDGRAAAFTAGGAFFGPFLGVTLSLTALQYIDAGVAASITAIYPIPTLLLAAVFHGERITWQALAGTIAAVAGVVVLFLR